MPKLYAAMFILLLTPLARATEFNCYAKDPTYIPSIRVHVQFAIKDGSTGHIKFDDFYQRFDRDVTYQAQYTDSLPKYWVYDTNKTIPIFRLETQGYCDDMSGTCDASGWTSILLLDGWNDLAMKCTNLGDIAGIGFTASGHTCAEATTSGNKTCSQFGFDKFVDTEKCTDYAPGDECGGMGPLPSVKGKCE